MSGNRSFRDFLAELRRRRVYRVAVVYAVVAYTMVQVATLVGPQLQLPDWTGAFVTLMALLGFPLAMILAWAYDVTPEGVKRDADAPDLGAANAAAVEGPRLSSKPARSVATRRGAGRREPARSAPAAMIPRPPLAQPGPGDLRRAMLATLRHELRTPLNAVIGYSEMLLEDLPPAQSGPVRAILTSGNRILALVNEILRPDTAEEELTDEVLASMRHRIREEMTAPTERLVQLCGEATVTVGSAGEGPAGDLERVTEAAERLRELVRSELAAHASADGHGATNGPTRALAERVIAGLPRGGAAAEDLPPKHGQILVVDDNEDNRELLSRQLARQGFSVSLVEDGEAALEALHAQDFDLVLLDVLMPGLDGIEVLAHMQTDAATREIPVIMTSALDEIEGVVRCIEHGAVDYLTKPFDPVLLQARIGATLDLYRLRAQQRRARQELEEEIAWSGRLIRSLVPDPLVERVREGRGTLVETLDSVTTLSVYLHGLGTFATRHGAAPLGEWVSETMAAFEEIAAEFPLEVHWDSATTLVVSSGPDDAGEDRSEAVATLALRLRDEGAARSAGADPVRIGIGMHTGPAVAALIDAERVAFGLWGESPDVARELAWQAPAGEVQASAASYAALHAAFNFEARGIIETSFRTQMRVYGLLGRREAPLAGGR